MENSIKEIQMLLEAVKNDTSSVEDTMRDFDSSIDELDSTKDDLESNIDDVASEISDLKSTCDDLESKCDDVERDYNIWRDKAEELISDRSRIHVKIDLITDAIEKIEKLLAQIPEEVKYISHGERVTIKGQTYSVIILRSNAGEGYFMNEVTLLDSVYFTTLPIATDTEDATRVVAVIESSFSDKVKELDIMKIWG